MTRAVAILHFMLDVRHASNQTKCLQDADRARVLDPRHPDNAELVSHMNTEACEQCFSFVDRITYVGMNMGPGHFADYFYLIMDCEKEKVCKSR